MITKKEHKLGRGFCSSERLANGIQVVYNSSEVETDTKKATGATPSQIYRLRFGTAIRL